MNNNQNNGGEQPQSVRLTGAWVREGKFGKFFVGKLSLADINKALTAFGNGIEAFEIVVSENQQKEKETSPDMTISLRLPRVKPADGGDTQGNTVGGARTTAPASAPRRAYGGRK